MKIIMAHHSPVRKGRILARLQEIGGVQVCFEASDLTETFNAAEHVGPDAVLMSDLLAQWPEFEVLKALFDALRIPCLLLDDGKSVARKNSSQSFSALSRISEDASVEELCSALKSVLTVRKPSSAPVVRQTTDLGNFDARKAILIGSSTGGVDALIRVLRSFPENCPPTLIVQHTGDGFAESLIRVLDRDARPHVVEAIHGRTISPGHVYLSTGKRHHLKFVPGSPARIALEEGPTMSGHRPSVDALFLSGLSAPKLVVAALLTGMGRDGAEGITALKRAGSFTIGQDKATSVVYGMPRVAFEMGGISTQLPIEQIGGELLRRCKVGVA